MSLFLTCSFPSHALFVMLIGYPRVSCSLHRSCSGACMRGTWRGSGDERLPQCAGFPSKKIWLGYLACCALSNLDAWTTWLLCRDALQKRFFGGSVVGAAWSRLSGSFAALVAGEKSGDEEGGDGAPIEGAGFSPVDQVPTDQHRAICQTTKPPLGLLCFMQSDFEVYWAQGPHTNIMQSIWASLNLRGTK